MRSDEWFEQEMQIMDRLSVDHMKDEMKFGGKFRLTNDIANVFEPRPPIHKDPPIWDVRLPNMRLRAIEEYQLDRIGRAWWREQINEDPTNNKEANMATATKGNNGVEKPVTEQQPKFNLFFRINDMPEQLTQKQAIEHTTKLLSLGASTIHITRVIRDDTSGRYANSY